MSKCRMWTKKTTSEKEICFKQNKTRPRMNFEWIGKNI